MVELEVFAAGLLHLYEMKWCTSQKLQSQTLGEQQFPRRICLEISESENRTGRVHVSGRETGADRARAPCQSSKGLAATPHAGVFSIKELSRAQELTAGALGKPLLLLPGL